MCQLVFCLSVYNRHVVCTFTQWHWAVCQISSLLHKRQSVVFFPRGRPRQHHRGLRIAQMSGQFSWTVRSTPRQRVVVRAHEKSRGWGDFVKSVMCGLYYTGVFCDIWTLLFFLVLFLFFRLMYICHNIIYLCLLMATSMFSPDFANKTFKLDLSLFTYVGHTN